MEKTEKKTMWLDCDPGADDAMAIFLACYSPKIDLLGISTVHGNSSLEKVTKNALRVLRMCGVHNIPVLKGLSRPLVRPPPAEDDLFHGESGIDGCELPESDQQPITQDVIYEIYTRIKSAKSKVHFVATGCLTNLATLLITYPDAKQYIEQISLMGGAVTLGNQTPSAEFNIYSDPEAAQMVFHCGLPLAMAPLDLTLQVKVDAAVISKLESFNSVFGKNVIGFLSFFLESYKSSYDFDFAPLHDPCAVYYIINPSAFTAKLLNVEIETKSEFSDGRTVVDVYNVTKREKNCLVLSNMNTEEFWKDMFEALILSNQNSPMNKNQEGNTQNSQ